MSAVAADSRSVSTTRNRASSGRESASGDSAPVVVLGLIVFVFVVLSTIIALRTPAWESADEPGHVQNVETLVSGHWYRMDPGSGSEAHQAPLYYMGLAAWQRIVGPPARVPNPGHGRLPAGPTGLFVHHSDSDHRFLLWLRLPNVVLGALTLLLTAWAVRAVTSDPWTPVVAAAVVAMTPRFLFLSAFVTNDNLATLLGALIAALAVRFLLAPAWWRAALLGGSVGLLIATKLSALPLAAVLVVTLLVRHSWRERVRLALLACLATLATSGWYLIQNAVRYGDPLARRASARYLGPIGGLGTFKALNGHYKVTDPVATITQHVPALILRGFWYTSGWNQFRWPLWASVPFWCVLALALAGLVRSRVSRRVLVTFGVLALTGFLSVWITAFQTASYEARLAFTGLPALACLAALGMERWKIPVRFLLPLMGLAGVLIAVHNDVLAVKWPR